MLETIDFTPKIGMNTYMLEFDIPTVYYRTYYNHGGNPAREPEPINDNIILQWKRQCEVEIGKRGLHFHDMGHGWTAEPFGICSSGGWNTVDASKLVPKESFQYLAELNGKRDLYHGVPLNTNVCMSNPKARAIMANYVADYAQTQNNVDFLHIWLADATSNHCECAECRKKITPDWYVMLLNDIDAELTRRNLKTHLVFIVYTETFWPPLETKINNPKRFTMLYAPIFRKYTETYAVEPDMSQLTPYNLNHNTNPRGMAACLAYLVEWKKRFSGDCFCYEYHFWRHQCYDPSGMYIARLLYDDIRGLKQNGLEGIVEDGSQRSYFPTGFAYYVYGETLYDSSVDYDELKRDYFSHLFGAEWEKVVAYLEKVRDAIPYAYMGRMMEGGLVQPSIAASAAVVRGYSDEIRPLIAACKNDEFRVRSVGWRLLNHFTDYVDGVADAVVKKASGDDMGAHEAYIALFDDFARREIYIERNFDFGMFRGSLGGVFSRPQQ